MKRSLACMLTAMAVASGAWAQTEILDMKAVKAEIKDIWSQRQWLFRQNFSVKVRSEELTRRLASEASKVLPIPVVIDVLLFRYTNGVGAVQADVSFLPSPYREQVEQKVTPKLNQLSTVKFLANTGVESCLNTGLKILKDDESLEVIKSTDALLDVEANDLDEAFHAGLKIRSVRAELDRKHRTVSFIKLICSEGKQLASRIQYAPVKIPGPRVGASTNAPATAGNTSRKEQMLLPSEALVDQTVFTNLASIPVPARFKVTYSEYNFETP